MQNQDEHLIQAAKQRAGLMGLINALLEEEQELTLNQIKGKIVRCVSGLVLLDAMVGDEIDYEVVETCKSYLESEQALEDVRDLLK